MTDCRTCVDKCFVNAMQDTPKSDKDIAENVMCMCVEMDTPTGCAGCKEGYHEYGYNAMVPTHALAPMRNLAPTKCGIGGLHRGVPDCLTTCHALMKKYCPTDSLSYCDDQCDQGGPPPPWSGDERKAAQVCGAQLNPQLGEPGCGNAASKCCQEECKGDAHCVAQCIGDVQECCMSSCRASPLCTQCHGAGPRPGPSPGPRPGPSPGPRPGPSPGPNGNGGKGKPSHTNQSFLSTTAGKVTMGLGGAVLLVLLVLAIMTAMKKKN
jgi:hypothetical protein